MQPELIPTRATLLDRLRDLDNHLGWQEFYDTYSGLIYELAVRSGLTDVEAQEVVQETIIGVAKNLPEFRYTPEKGSFKSWLFNIVRWRVADQFKLRHLSHASAHRSEDDDKTATIDRVPGPEPPNEIEARWEEGWDNAVYKLAVEQTKKRVAPKHYQIFDFCVFKAWPVSKISQTLEISTAQVYLIKFRVGRILKKQIRKLEKQHGGPESGRKP